MYCHYGEYYCESREVKRHGKTNWRLNRVSVVFPVCVSVKHHGLVYTGHIDNASCLSGEDQLTCLTGRDKSISCR